MGPCLEIIAICFIFLIFVFLLVLSLEKAKKLSLSQSIFIDLRKHGVTWVKIEKMATLSALLSIWLTLAMYYINENQKQERLDRTFISLTSDFIKIKNENLATIEYIELMERRNFFGIDPFKLADLDTFHIELLLINPKVSGSYRVDALIILKKKLKLANESIFYLKQLHAGDKVNFELFPRILGVTKLTSEIRILYNSVQLE